MTRLAQDCYHGSETCRFTEPSKNHLAGWFFRLQSKRLRRSGKDLKKIFPARWLKRNYLSWFKPHIPVCRLPLFHFLCYPGTLRHRNRTAGMADFFRQWHRPRQSGRPDCAGRVGRTHQDTLARDARHGGQGILPVAGYRIPDCTHNRYFL